jgi:hypothetical protein
MRTEIFNELREIEVRADGAIEYVDPHNGEHVVLFPVWLEGDPRGVPPS